MQTICKLTVVVPVFNTELYLEESLSCIENQSFGLENMEVILINDGSTDSSAEICHCFLEKHKETVRYVELAENQGVSHAKNIALDMASGMYITFWDSDDLWSQNAMEKAVSFLEKHEDEIDMVSCNIKYFDNDTGEHVLNFEIENDTIIDIQQDYQKIRTSGSACVMRTKTAKQFCFDENQRRWEDAGYINQVLLQKKKYGMVKGIYYYYRRRKSNNSATQSHYGDKNYYLYDLDVFFRRIYETSLKQCGEFIPMMQYLAAYTLGYYFSENVTILDKKEYRQYDIIRKDILSYVEDRYVKEIPNVDFLIKWKMLSFKYGLEMEDEISEWRRKEQAAQWNLLRVARITANYNVLKRWFVLKQHNKTLKSYFEKNNYRRIAIYGMSDLGKYLLEELADSSIKVVCGIDKRAERLTFRVPVLTMEEIFPDVDAIIVTAVYFFQEIKEALRKKVNCPVLSLEDVLDAEG